MHASPESVGDIVSYRIGSVARRQAKEGVHHFRYPWLANGTLVKCVGCLGSEMDLSRHREETASRKSNEASKRYQLTSFYVHWLHIQGRYLMLGNHSVCDLR